MTIAQALKIDPDLKQWCEQNTRANQLIQLARKVEGMPRHVSTHAAGVVISEEPLTNYVPLQQGSGNIPLTQYSMEYLEKTGLLKIDFLGLRYLSVIERTLDWIYQWTGTRMDIHHLDYEDDKTYALMVRGETTGVFQLESAGMRKVLRELQPSAFEDVVSVLALYRPGPMAFIPQYIQAKRGQRRVTYPHPHLRNILEETYGIIVYQEQIMQIAAKMAGFHLGEADLLRRAVSKKKREILEKEREHFVSGCLKQGYSKEVADRVYDMIVRFADYGFPKAHATAYGMLAYQTAYLKANYPAPFMASMLTAVLGNHQKIAEYIDECRRMSIEVLPPDINESEIHFTPFRKGDDYAIRFGLGAVKNVGLTAIENIIKVRREGAFRDLSDFCRRVDLKICGKKVIESLILAGAFDQLPGHRAQLLVMLDEVIESSMEWKQEREDLQIHLIGLTEQINWQVEYPNVPPMDSQQVLKHEKELLGIYLSGHPLDHYESRLKGLPLVPVHQLSEYPEFTYVTIAGMVLTCKSIVTKNGKQMAFVEVEDRIGKVEVVVFPNVWQTSRVLLQEGGLIWLRGKLQYQEEKVKLIADRIGSLKHLPFSTNQDTLQTKQEKSDEKKAEAIFIKISSDKEKSEILSELKHILMEHSGASDVFLYYDRSHKTLALSRQYRVEPSKELFHKIEAVMGAGSVRLK